MSDDLADELEAEIGDLRDLLADRSVRSDIEVVDPDYFPPCIARLLERARAGEELDPHGRFSLLAFLAGLNLEADEAVALSGLDPARGRPLRLPPRRVRRAVPAAVVPDARRVRPV
ncbi:hypothetical protein ACFQRB_02790 [Halobaculum litoreum]|uniref:DNA primase large subunit C-terminal domain-containing protein n=1 Tax=Halobaculum litoreum TaxID=3031998 RepID=A0ABD5XKZ3_9EURY